MGKRAGEQINRLTIDALGADEVSILPWPLLLRRRVQERAMASSHYPWIVLATVLFGLFSVGFSITILSVSIPRIAEELGSTQSTISWVVTAPILTFAIFGPSAGKLGDLRGQRRIYGISMACVVVFAGLTALSWNAGSLIAFRTLGAATGAAIGPTSLALINRMFPPNRRAQAMGYWSMVAAGGPVVGVVAGGPIVEAFGWRWIFVGQVPLTIAGLLLAMGVLPETERRSATRFDVPGAVSLALAATSLLLAINRAPFWGYTDPRTLVLFVIAPISIVVFVRVEARVAQPLLPLRYLRRRNFSVPIAVQVFINFAYMGSFILTPLLLEEVFGYGESKTGAIVIGRPLAFAIAGPVAGALTVRIGERIAAVVGSATVLASMLCMSAVGVGTSDAFIIGSLALAGVGLGVSAPALSAAIANTVDDEDLGVAGAAQQMMSQFGVVLGIQIMVSLKEARIDDVGAEAAFTSAYLAGAGAAAGAVVIALFVRSSRDPLDDITADDEAVAAGSH